MQKTSKYYKSIDLIGCSPEVLQNWLESKFKPGMTWDNHGFYGWHVDHVIPCAVFDLADPKQQKKCFNYKNLQPLWQKENFSKGIKILGKKYGKPRKERYLNRNVV